METSVSPVSSLPAPPPRCLAHPSGILVAEARPLFRCGLVHVLAQSFAGHQVHEVGTAEALLQAVGDQAPALVIMTTNLLAPTAAPGSLLAALREVRPQLAIIIMADPATTSELTMLLLLRQRISGLLMRTATAAEVCATVGAVLQHGHHYDDYALGLLQNQLPHRCSPREGFSARQLDVLRLIAADYSNEEIAEYLCTSVRTVEYHRSQMLQKASARTTLGLVLFAQRQGLLAAGPDKTPVPMRSRLCR